MEIKRALFSLFDKEGCAEFARELVELGVQIVSSGGTSKHLEEQGISATPVEELTQSPEMLGGRVKTLHPRLHGGILAKRSKPDHMAELEQHGIQSIDLVACNLYPFEKVTRDKDCDLAKALENIDIGGPTMVRAAAKNFEGVAILVDPADYPRVAAELKETGKLSYETRYQLSLKAFELAARYDVAIVDYLKGKLPETGEDPLYDDGLYKFKAFKRKRVLRYGENPHQSASLYSDLNHVKPAFERVRKIQGKDLSYNNFLDMDGAVRLVREFTDEPTCSIVKHSSPTGVASASEVAKAYFNAREVDPLSAFGGIAAFNCEVDEECAKLIMETFMEVIVAPAFTDAAKKVFKTKKALRIVEYKLAKENFPAGMTEMRETFAGHLEMEIDRILLANGGPKVVTKSAPTEQEMKDLIYGWKVVKTAKSNAIVLARGDRSIGTGAGQTSRVDACMQAILKANTDDRGWSKGACLASDAFIPFRDVIDLAAEAGVRAIIQPGGSVGDEKVIEACDEHGIAMVFTGIRHFRH